MGKYFIGKGVQLLTEETENKIRIYKLGLLQPEFGHMPCISGNAFTFLLAEEGEIQCQINQEDRKSTRLNSSHSRASRMPSSA